jgi:hypothetical protein
LALAASRRFGAGERARYAAYRARNAQLTVAALISYCRAEATASLASNRGILGALVKALIGADELNGEQVDQIITTNMSARAIEL